MFGHTTLYLWSLTVFCCCFFFREMEHKKWSYMLKQQNHQIINWTWFAWLITIYHLCEQICDAPFVYINILYIKSKKVIKQWYRRNTPAAHELNCSLLFLQIPDSFSFLLLSFNSVKKQHGYFLWRPCNHKMPYVFNVLCMKPRVRHSWLKTEDKEFRHRRILQ